MLVVYVATGAPAGLTSSSIVSTALPEWASQRFFPSAAIPSMGDEADPLTTPPPVTPAQCADGLDNDADGQVDLGADPGCATAADNDETDPPLPQCSDGDDNDNDGKSDLGFDLGCSSPLDNDETDPPKVAPLPRPQLLSPFPVVRLRGRLATRGVLINLLTVRAPAGARVTVTCRGPKRSCPRGGSSTRAVTGSRVVRFRPFERSMRVGTILRIFVTKPGFVGKYTRFTIRRRAAPARSDACARSNNTSMTCPR